MGSGKHLKNAISKYGIENFKKETLFQFDNEAEMNAKEAELVTEEFCLREDTYNICPGGKGGWGYNNTQEGQTLREFSYKRWSKAGAKAFSDLFNNDIEFQNQHKKHLLEAGQVAQKTIKEKYPNGIFYKRTHSENTKRIMSEKAAMRTGGKNSQFGSMWITNGYENSKIKKDVDIIPEGWYKGRVIVK